MSKSRLFIFYTFLISHTFCIEQITKEYPELIPFFNSEQFQKNIHNFSIQVIESEQQKMAVELCLSVKGISRTLIISSNLINRNYITAAELQFMICHELGHVNDPHLYWAGMIPKVIWTSATVGATVDCIINLFKQKPGTLKQCVKTCCTSLIGLAVVQYLARSGEYFADEYGLTLTQNKEAAYSILKKRYKWFEKESQSNSLLIQFLKDLFADHPPAEKRINNLEKY